MFDVLIVEDDEKIAFIHKKMIERINQFNVKSIAHNIDDAIEFTKILKPHLIILDIYFPDDLNGIDFLKWLRQSQIESDVIVITAAREYNILQKTLKKGIFDYLIKPVSLTRLQSALDRYLKVNLTNQSIIEQSDVDKIIFGTTINEIKSNLPKGIDNLTLKKVKDHLSNLNTNFITAECLSEKLGISRSTARRYLEYLVSIGQLNIDQDYGTKGRPERKYFLK